jgi:hypothetical protein
MQACGGAIDFLFVGTLANPSMMAMMMKEKATTSWYVAGARA